MGPVPAGVDVQVSGCLVECLNVKIGIKLSAVLLQGYQPYCAKGGVYMYMCIQTFCVSFNSPIRMHPRLSVVLVSSTWVVR